MHGRDRASTRPHMGCRAGCTQGGHQEHTETAAVLDKSIALSRAPAVSAAAVRYRLAESAAAGRASTSITWHRCTRRPARMGWARHQHQHIQVMSSSSATSISKPSPGYLSSLGQQRHSAGSRTSNSLTKRPSMVRITEQFVPSRNVPADVKPRNMASAQMLGREMSEVMSFFDGRESEANWVQRERAVVLFRAIIWGNSAIEFCSELVAMFREHIHEIVKAVNSLRTSLSGHGMRLCEDIAMRLGPHASPLFDPIVGALLKQCAQTKKIAAQAAASAMAVVFQHFPLRAKAIETLRYYIADKSPVLRLAVVTTCTCVLRSHATVLQHSSGDRRSTEVFAHISVVAKQGVMDAQPSVREPSRELFWEFYNVSALNARKLLASLPASTQAMLNRDKDRYVKGAQDAASVDRPMSAASVVRVPSAQQLRAHSPPAAQSLSQEPPMPSLMNVVSGYSVPQNATLFPQQINDHSLLSADAQLGLAPRVQVCAARPNCQQSR
ncbi:hypothetical protein DL89DRAFT_105631 [Linderina pennispora]|uniref:CLASP N-terminal domain-containing protein n=1 Tax=Linderina pennispora TaxID=61395 RepID=A0A1Y1WFB5_9FUNG|nr:uncharacterized protein DL89DRAFT_105631 [Linderina pennispora]ORX72008.1 hypothetical protein DL89DRAFT_105631 [Linderina pennispora]